MGVTMVQCDWVIICDHTLRDELGKVCLIGVFDQIAVADVPTTVRRMALAFRFSGTPGDGRHFFDSNRPTGRRILVW